MSDGRAKRLSDANAVIREVGMRGRRFFYSDKHDRFSRFEIDRGGRLRFFDHYSGKSIAVIKHCRWRGFTGGGTLRALVERLARYIREGMPIPSRHFGPWPDYVCDGDLWGYGLDQMAELRSSLRNNAAVHFVDENTDDSPPDCRPFQRTDGEHEGNQGKDEH